MFAEERPALGPLPVEPWVSITSGTSKTTLEMTSHSRLFWI